MSRLSQPRIVLPAILLFMLLAITFVGTQLAVQSRSPLSCIVEDHRTGGGSGIRQWAELAGYQTMPLRTPIWEISDQLPEVGNCLLTAGDSFWTPNREKITLENWRDLKQWILAGNTLIVITSDWTSLPTPVQEYFTIDVSPQKSEWEIDFYPSDPHNTSEETTDIQPVPTVWGGELHVQSQNSRLVNLPGEFQKAGSGNSTVLAGRPTGEGMIYLLLEGSVWSNLGFDRGDNAATLARVLHEHLHPQGVLAFDEYRHGHGRVESFLTFFLSLPGAKYFTLMATLWGIFWLWGSTRRLGLPDEYREFERRTAKEYVDSVAAMNLRARAAPLAVTSVLQRVRYLLQKKGPLSATACQLFDRAEAQVSVAARPANPRQEIELVSELIQLRKEFHGTRSSS